MKVQEARLKPGLTTSEFLGPIAVILIGAALTLHEPTKEVGVFLLGWGVNELREYRKGRERLKARALSAAGAT